MSKFDKMSPATTTHAAAHMEAQALRQGCWCGWRLDHGGGPDARPRGGTFRRIWHLPATANTPDTLLFAVVQHDAQDSAGADTTDDFTPGAWHWAVWLLKPTATRVTAAAVADDPQRADLHFWPARTAHLLLTMPYTCQGRWAMPHNVTTSTNAAGRAQYAGTEPLLAGAFTSAAEAVINAGVSVEDTYSATARWPAPQPPAADGGQVLRTWVSEGRPWLMSMEAIFYTVLAGVIVLLRHGYGVGWDAWITGVRVPEMRAALLALALVTQLGMIARSYIAGMVVLSWRRGEEVHLLDGYVLDIARLASRLLPLLAGFFW